MEIDVEKEPINESDEPKIIKLDNSTALKDEEGFSAPLCEKCGNRMIEEDGKAYCSHCDTEIDYFGDDDDENN